MAQKVLVIGASLKAERYSNIAINMLVDYGHELVALGLREGDVSGVVIQNNKINFEGIDTVTLYLNPVNQEEYKSYIIGLKPRRVIFNPGTENQSFWKTLQEKGIHVEVACTLVLLRTNQFEIISV
jgi:predicted CoA-binding protein